MGSNCTFMELKFATVLCMGAKHVRSNCTFMELKLLIHNASTGVAVF